MTPIYTLSSFPKGHSICKARAQNLCPCQTTQHITFVATFKGAQGWESAGIKKDPECSSGANISGDLGWHPIRLTSIVIILFLSLSFWITRFGGARRGKTQQERDQDIARLATRTQSISSGGRERERDRELVRIECDDGFGDDMCAAQANDESRGMI